MERLTYQAECSQLIAQDKFKQKIKSKISSESDVETINMDDDEFFDEDDEFADIDEEDEYFEDDDEDGALPFDVEAHRAQCDKLIADYKDNFFHSKLLGYFASHPETDERTLKFRASSSARKENQ